MESAMERLENSIRLPIIGAFFSNESSTSQKVIYTFLGVVVAYYTIVALLAPFLVPACPLAKSHRNITTAVHLNPDYDFSHQGEIHEACHMTRYAVLGGMNYWECDMSMRVLMSLMCGTIVGWERRRADRPAGIRTMALVCLGSCVFTLGSLFAFIDGPMAWDASRVSAAIPSGVGFLGAASIWKGTAKAAPDQPDGTGAPEIHGLTTATSVWLSAAIGILCGGALYVPALFSTCVAVTYLRFAPRSLFMSDRSASWKADSKDSLAALAVPLNPDGSTQQPLPKRVASLCV